MDSVLRQTFSDWEQIIIDDGSMDGTAELVAGYHDSRIRYNWQAKQGPFKLADSYNLALSLAKGDLIAVLEGDDFWPSEKLAMLVPRFRDDAVVLAYGERVDVDAHGKRQRRKTDTARRRERLADCVFFNDPIGSATRYMLLEGGRSLVGPCTVVIRRTALERIGGFQFVAGLPLTDYPTFLELSLVGKFWYSRQTMGYFRRHQGSITVNHARIIHDAVSDFATEFVDRHSNAFALLPSDWEMTKQSWREAGDRLHFSEGRMLLLEKRWSDARKHFRLASRSRSAKVRAASVAGMLLSLAHMDIEPLMRLGGRADLRVPRPPKTAADSEIPS
jgi:glycosyltransferase involved in cell wall biosynthesis